MRPYFEREPEEFSIACLRSTRFGSRLFGNLSAFKIEVNRLALRVTVRSIACHAPQTNSNALANEEVGLQSSGATQIACLKRVLGHPMSQLR